MLRIVRELRWVLAISCLLLISCSGSQFMPSPGPFGGSFISEGTEVGTFSLTTGNNLVSGSGTIFHNNSTINVSISAAINGKVISGKVENTLLGTGDFVGSFAGENRGTGTFNFTDTLGMATTTGTWTAALPTN